MSLITERNHEKRLKTNNIKVKTYYKVGDSILETMNDSINPDIVNGIRLGKKYYKDDLLIGEVNKFDSRIHYSYSSPSVDKDKCPNCGMEIRKDKYEDCCPFCRTSYNLDYIDKEVSNKESYDYIIHNNKYIWITLINDIIVSALLVYLYIASTSRTFNIYDISKIVVYTILVSTVLYFVFYTLDAYILLGPIKRYKESRNRDINNFWNSVGYDKVKFFNNLMYELEEYYFSNKSKDIIDFDIIDYNSFDKTNVDGKEGIIVNILIRFVTINGNAIKTNVEEKNCIFQKADITQKKQKDGVNIIDCRKCGASIDITKNECPYCRTKTNYLQEWYLYEIN